MRHQIFVRTGVTMALVGLVACDYAADRVEPEMLPPATPHMAGPQPPEIAPMAPPVPSSPGFLEFAQDPYQLRAVPISGGTLAISADQSTAAAADPDRDQVYIVDLLSEQLRFTVALEAMSEPGRIVFDDQGALHVATRRGGQLVSIDASTGEVLSRRDVCAAPRGVAFQETTRQLHVACQTGELVSFGLGVGDEPRRLDLGRDLRDVVVVGDELRVSRFKTAEVLSLDSAGKLLGTHVPGAVRQERSDPFTGELKPVTFAPNVAWRMIAVADGGAMVVHQESLVEEIQLTQSTGYGSFGCSGGIVRSAVSLVKGGQLSRLTSLGGLSHTDIAVNRRGSFVAVAAGESVIPTLGGNIFFGQLEAPAQAVVDPLTVPAAQAPGGISPLVLPPMAPADDPGSSACSHQSVYVDSEVTSVGFGPEGVLVVQSREPARLTLIDPLSHAQLHIALSAESRSNTGSRLFHSNTGMGISCATCHPEGSEDGHVWSFEGVGPRRSQNISGGVLSTLPLHWDAEFTDFSSLIQEVMLRRMGGQPLNEAQVAGLGAWIDQLPSPAAKVVPAAALESGKLAFAKAKCGDCHAGANLTNNRSYDVGTGGELQTPSLKGIGARAPFMHNGCAATLQDRFDVTCGGAKHGDIAALSPPELAALGEYLETL